MAATSSERSRPNPDQTIVGILRDDIYEGQTFERIPEHVTFLPWFSLKGEYQRSFVNALMNRMHYVTPLELVGEKHGMLGPNQDIPGTILKLGTLASFHAKVLDIVRRYDGKVHSEYLEDKFLPHVTDTADYKYGVDENQTLNTVQLVSADRETGMRRVEKVLSLSGGRHGEPTARH